MVIWSVLSSKCSMPAQQVAGGPHLSGVDVSVGEIAAAQQRGDLVGVKPVVLGLAAVDRLHVEGMAEDEGEALLFAQVGHPVPAEEALDGNAQILSVRPEGFDELVAVAGELAVDEGLAGLIEDAEVQAAGVQVNAAVVLVLLGVESHRGLLSRGLWIAQQPTAWVGREGASNQYPTLRADRRAGDSTRKTVVGRRPLKRKRLGDAMRLLLMKAKPRRRL